MTTKYFKMYELLHSTSEQGTSPEMIQECIEIPFKHVAIYIHAMRTKFGATISTTKVGKKITAYHLDTTVDNPKRPQEARQKPGPRTAKVAKTKASPDERQARKINHILDTDLPFSHVSEKEFSDLRFQLGLD